MIFFLFWASGRNPRELLTNSFQSQVSVHSDPPGCVDPEISEQNMLNRNQRRLSSTQVAECIVDSEGAEKKLGVRLRYLTSISLLHCTMVPEKRLSTANLVSVCMFMGSVRRPRTPIVRRTFWRT